MVSALCAFKAALPWGDYLLLCQHVHITDVINELERHFQLKKKSLHSAELCVRPSVFAGAPFTKVSGSPSSCPFSCCNCSVRKTLPPKWEGPSDPATEAATLVVSVCCWRVSWPHHSRQPDQRLWHRGGIIKAPGGRGQQPDVTLRFPSSTGWGKDTGLWKKRSDPLCPIPISSDPIGGNWKWCSSLFAPHFVKQTTSFSVNAGKKKQKFVPTN